MTRIRAAAFYDYLNEREEIRLRKEAGFSFPWTDDEILRTYKFTNVRRHHDRTSMMLRDIFYNRRYDEDRPTILMNCALFRYFGTWEFAQEVGWQKYNDFDFEGIKSVAESRLANKERVFTGAYVITNQGISAPKQEVVVDYFLKDLHAAVPKIIEIVDKTQSWKSVSQRMKQIGGFGGTGFMTKEVLLDTTYTGFWANRSEQQRFSYPCDWRTWTPIGPGALRGAARVLGLDYETKVSERMATEVIMSLVEEQDSLWAHDGDLVPTDIQFGLCEFDKYERVLHGQGKPRSRYRNDN